MLARAMKYRQHAPTQLDRFSNLDYRASTTVLSNDTRNVPIRVYVRHIATATLSCMPSENIEGSRGGCPNRHGGAQAHRRIIPGYQVCHVLFVRHSGVQACQSPIYSSSYKAPVASRRLTYVQPTHTCATDPTQRRRCRRSSSTAVKERFVLSYHTAVDEEEMLGHIHE